MTPCNVLFLCTGNAARSILAEAILNRIGAPRFAAYSAGAQPKVETNPQAIALLGRLGFETDGLRPKSWNAFAAPGALRLDLVVTVCDRVAGEACPVWRGRPVIAHWSVPDPFGAGRSEAEAAQALGDVYRLLETRIAALCALPLERLDRRARQKAIEAIATGPAQGHPQARAASGR